MAHKNHQRQQNQTWLGPQVTFFKNWVDWSQRLSMIPDNRMNSVRNNETMSILPLTLNFGLCLSFSKCTALRLKGYCTPALWVELLIEDLKKFDLQARKLMKNQSASTVLNSQA